MRLVGIEFVFYTFDVISCKLKRRKVVTEGIVLLFCINKHLEKYLEKSVRNMLISKFAFFFKIRYEVITMKQG